MIGSLPPTKGVSAYTAQLLGALALRSDMDVEFIGFRSIYPRWAYPGGDPQESSVERPARVPNVRYRGGLSWYNPLSWAWAGLRLRGDVVHAQWWSYALAPVYAVALAPARLRGKRIVLTAHNIEPHEGGLLRRLANRAVFRFAHRFIVHSEANKTTLQRMLRCDPGRITVLPHGVLESTRTGMSRPTARLRLGLPGDARVVLCFGNIRPYKGVDVLLRAFAEVARDDPRATLLVAGQPWGDWAPYARLIDELDLSDRVRAHLQYIPAGEIEQYFIAADLVVLPYTHFDAQSGVGTRALPFGRPLVVTNTGGLSDLVLDPDAVVPAGDAHALARAITRVLADNAVRDQPQYSGGMRSQSARHPSIAKRSASRWALSRTLQPIATRRRCIAHESRYRRAGAAARRC
jgi:glycosyltransferase involved in cell wall biosynthesis